MYGEMTRGRAALLRVLRRTEVRFVAARCRVQPTAVYNWLSGRRRPRRAQRALLEVNYRIEPSWWDELASTARRVG